MKPANPEAWEELKNKGEEHYKTGDIEPVDLYLAGDMLRDFAIGNIIKYAYRNRTNVGCSRPLNMNDMAKIKGCLQALSARNDDGNGLMSRRFHHSHPCGYQCQIRHRGRQQ